VTNGPTATVTDALRDALAPLIETMVKAEVAQQLARADRQREQAEFLTTAEYAGRFKTTPGAVLARIHRRTLHAVRPPGSREWLIPVDRGYHEP
jgi:hypothetical protein